MRLLIILLALSMFSDNNYNTNALTRSMGQEVIEIGTPIKDLPPGLDEEPSAEVDDVRSASQQTNSEATTVILTSTDVQKVATASDNLSDEDEERRVEKELAEMYKDTDYKSAEVVKESDTTISEEAFSAAAEHNTSNARRAETTVATQFKFQPDVNDAADVDRFRTSVDDIYCEKKATQHLQEKPSGGSIRAARNLIAMFLALISILICQ